MLRELLVELRKKDRRVEQLEHRLTQLLRQVYGRRSEKLNPDQLLLFADLTEAPPPAETPAPPAETPEEAAPGPRKKGHGRKPLPDNLPRVRVDHELPAAERLCPACGKERAAIGEEVSEQLEYEPASLFVLQHHRCKYACKHCQEQVAIAAKPAQPIDKGLPGPGLLAQVATCKYSDHLPLHRLERIFARHGVDI